MLVARDPGRWSLPRSLREHHPAGGPRRADPPAHPPPPQLDPPPRLAGRDLRADLRRPAPAGGRRRARQVVEIGIDVLLRRWLIRQFAHFWTDSRDDDDLVPWKHGGPGAPGELRVRPQPHPEGDLRRAQPAPPPGHAQPGGGGAREPARRAASARPWPSTTRPPASGRRRSPTWSAPSSGRSAVRAGDAARRYCDQAIEVLSRLVAGARSEAAAETLAGGAGDDAGQSHSALLEHVLLDQPRNKVPM